MFYTMEEAAIIGGFLELYLERDSVDPAVREQHRRFRQGLMCGTLERADYEWAAAVLGFLLFSEIPAWTTWLGASIVIGAGIYNLHRERIRARERRAAQA